MPQYEISRDGELVASTIDEQLAEHIGGLEPYSVKEI